jgi:hypothetical protein
VGCPFAETMGLPGLLPTHNNLTPAEKGALQELKERDDIVIKSADKGSAVVVMDKVDYFFCGVPIC